MAEAGEPEILCERRGRVGLLVLDRPRALNALTLDMVRAMRRALDAWAADEGVTSVVLTAAGDRAFCAGGDIRRLHDLGREGRFAEALTFWREEYALDTLIHRYPKPYVSLIDGVVLGGGVGLTLHGRHRVAGERYALAMPEVGIGFFPDVGATYALPRLPGATGMFLALTGERVRQGDALALGLATHAAPGAAFPAIVAALAEGEDVREVLNGRAVAVAPGALAAERGLIDEAFAGSSVPEILHRLDTDGSERAKTLAATIRTKSPTSLAIACEQMLRGPRLGFEEAMRTEYAIVSRIVRGHDFYEGVRAAIVDKDGAPVWRPARLDEVDPEEVRRHFEPDA